MPQKTFELSDGTPVTVTKRVGSTSLRLSINAKGLVRVSLPRWMPYRAATAFAEARLTWIHSQRQIPSAMPQGHQIGREHRIQYRISIKATKVTSRLTNELILITHPIKIPFDAADVQVVAEKAAIRALRSEAEQLLPGRLRELAGRHGFMYSSVSIKQLAGRWGSCDQQQHIALNLFLMQLPDDLINYVLIHELVHTIHMHHGADFWNAFETILPGAKKFRSQISKHKPVVVR